MMLGMSGTPTILVSVTRNNSNENITNMRVRTILLTYASYFPDDFSGITISAGDSILMTVTATSKTSGSAVIENLTTGKTVSETFSDVSDGSLCEYDAEWIVEDFEECGSTCSLVPFADFGTVTFTDVSATISGSTVYPSDATVLDIKQSNKVLTDCSTSASEVSCSYV